MSRDCAVRVVEMLAERWLPWESMRGLQHSTSGSLLAPIAAGSVRLPAQIQHQPSRGLGHSTSASLLAMEVQPLLSQSQQPVPISGGLQHSISGSLLAPVSTGRFSQQSLRGLGWCGPPALGIGEVGTAHRVAGGWGKEVAARKGPCISYIHIYRERDVGTFFYKY